MRAREAERAAARAEAAAEAAADADAIPPLVRVETDSGAAFSVQVGAARARDLDASAHEWLRHRAAGAVLVSECGSNVCSRSVSGVEAATRVGVMRYSSTIEASQLRKARARRSKTSSSRSVRH